MIAFTHFIICCFLIREYFLSRFESEFCGLICWGWVPVGVWADDFGGVCTVME